jgi:hypothetical protein
MSTFDEREMGICLAINLELTYRVIKGIMAEQAGRAAAGRRRFGAGLFEESPHSTGHGAGEIPGRGNLPDRATETDRPQGSG